MPATPPPSMSVDSWPNIDIGSIKVDRIHVAEDVKRSDTSRKSDKANKLRAEPRFYPVYTGIPETPLPVYTAIDAPTPLIDLTTKPGEVQADFALDFPYNGFRFQNPTPVISA